MQNNEDEIKPGQQSSDFELLTPTITLDISKFLSSINIQPVIAMPCILDSLGHAAQRRRAAYITYNGTKIPRNETSLLNHLPQGVVLKIFSLLSVAALGRTSVTCQEYNSLIKLNEIWTKKLHADFGFTPYPIDPCSIITHLDDKPHKTLYQEKLPLQRLFTRPLPYHHANTINPQLVAEVMKYGIVFAHQFK